MKTNSEAHSVEEQSKSEEKYRYEETFKVKKLSEYQVSNNNSIDLFLKEDPESKIITTPANGYCYFNALFAGIIMHCIGNKDKLNKFCEALKAQHGAISTATDELFDKYTNKDNFEEKDAIELIKESTDFIKEYFHPFIIAAYSGIINNTHSTFREIYFIDPVITDLIFDKIIAQIYESKGLNLELSALKAKAAEHQGALNDKDSSAFTSCENSISLLEKNKINFKNIRNVEELNSLFEREFGFKYTDTGLGENLITELQALQRGLEIIHTDEKPDVIGQAVTNYIDDFIKNCGYQPILYDVKSNLESFKNLLDKKEDNLDKVIIRQSDDHYNVIITDRIYSKSDKQQQEKSIYPITVSGISKVAITENKYSEIKARLLPSQSNSTNESKGEDQTEPQLTFFRPKIEFSDKTDSTTNIGQKFDFSSTNSSIINANKEELQNGTKQIINQALEAALSAVTAKYKAFNKAEAALCIMLAIKNGGVGNNKEDFKKDLKEFYSDTTNQNGEISNEQLKPYLLFSKLFQENIKQENIFTGNQEAKKLVGMRLKRLTPDYAYEMLEKCFPEEAAKNNDDEARKTVIKNKFNSILYEIYNPNSSSIETPSSKPAEATATNAFATNSNEKSHVN